MTRAEGGRKKPPPGGGSPPYAAVVGFPDSEGPQPPSEAWSFVVEKVEDEGDEYQWLANVRFLVNHAPHDELRPNRHFVIYEGARAVAFGTLLYEPPVASEPSVPDA